MLVTRPEPGLRETMQAVAGLGYRPVACPMLRIVMRRPRLPSPRRLDAIVLTSGQAVDALAGAARTEPAWLATRLLAVGDRTARRARDAGFTSVDSAQGDAATLAALVRASLPPGAAILLASGARQGDALAARLRQDGLTVHRRVVYAARPAPALAAEARAALAAGAVTACLFLSAETADSFVRRYPAALLPVLATVDAMVIGQGAAGVLGALPWRGIQVADRPDADAVVALLRRTGPTARRQS
ncbi:uroporphyrinogen-III synthase [Lichenicoccus roseus]|uniref:uroporphyrinogen-III synthase n=1 Tax=Lichenicoccus roseus TaxID=2683649 RepID=UPI001F0F4109|nr:uroporphyrinogen-III synthase [Lichenicoccus roseus]